MVRLSSTLMVLVMSAIALVACGSDDRAKPGDRLTLTFTGKSHSEYLFTLENPTSHAVYFRVFKSLWFAPIPVDTAFDCKNEKTREATVGGFPLFDGGKDRVQFMWLTTRQSLTRCLTTLETNSWRAANRHRDRQKPEYHPNTRESRLPDAPAPPRTIVERPA